MGYVQREAPVGGRASEELEEAAHLGGRWGHQGDGRYGSVKVKVEDFQEAAGLARVGSG